MLPNGGSMGSQAPSTQRVPYVSELMLKVTRDFKPPASVRDTEQDAFSEDSYSVIDGLTSLCSSGIATPSREVEYVEVNSQKSPLSPLSDPSLLILKVQIMETLISNIFTTVSSLKNAYVQLQAAHTPYDPEKLQIADGAVIAELKRLSELKHSYRERDAAIRHSSEPEQQHEAILKSYEGMIGNFNIEIQKKNAEVEKLKNMLAQSARKKEKLERRVKRLEQKMARDSCVKASSDTSLTPQLFESAVLAASEAARSFTKLLISLMKSAQWDLDAASNSIEPGINYARRSHRKYAFESYVCHRMLSGFESENFYVNGDLPYFLDPEKHRQECFHEFQEMRAVDPLELVGQNPDGPFGKFCLSKFLQVVHPKMEESFFRNFEHRDQVSNGNHPRSEFYQCFLKLAKAVWLLHRLSFSFDPTASIFQVRRGIEFSPLYMESIVQLADMEDNGPRLQRKVGFTVMPGFRLGKAAIKCQVYTTAVKDEQ